MMGKQLAAVCLDSAMRCGHPGVTSSPGQEQVNKEELNRPPLPSTENASKPDDHP